MVEGGGRRKYVYSQRCSKVKVDLKALRNMTEEEYPPRRHIRPKRQVVAYLMQDTTRLGFGSVMW